MGITWGFVKCLRIVRPDVNGLYQIPPYGYDHVLAVYADGSSWMIACVLSDGEDLSLALHLAYRISERYRVPVETPPARKGDRTDG